MSESENRFFEASRAVRTEHQHINDERFEDIESIADLRNLLEEEGLTFPGIGLTQDDYEAVMIRANKVLEKHPEMDEKTALANAYVDRLSIMGETGVQMLEKIDVQSLVNIFSARLGRTVSTEDVQMVLRRLRAGFRAQDENLVTEWSQARSMVEGSPDNVAVVDREDLVRLVEDGGPAALLSRVVTEEGELPQQ